MTKRITEAAAAALQAKDSDRDEFIFDALLSGYGLRRTPAGVVIHLAVARAAGRKVRITLGKWPALKTAEARSLAGMAIADVREGRDPLLERRARLRAAAVNGVTVSAYAEKWMEHVRLKRRAKTFRDYDHAIKRHVLPAFGHRTIAELRLEDVEALHAKLKATPRTANYTITILGTMLVHAVKAGLRPDNPCREVVRYREAARERFLSPREFAAVIETIDKSVGDKGISPRAGAGIKLLAYSGARRSEIRAAMWSHVDWNRRLVRLPDSKTGVPRTLFLNDSAIDVLRSLPRDSGPIIGGGEAFLNAAWGVVRGRCGLRDVRLHDFRHSYASAALAAGVPLAQIGKLLGHRSTSATARYAHLAADDVAAAGNVVGVALAGMTATPMTGTVVKMPRRRRR
jgi:integrase